MRLDPRALAVAGALLTGGTFLDAVRSGQVRTHAFEMLDSLLLILILADLAVFGDVAPLSRSSAAEPPSVPERIGRACARRRRRGA